MTYLEALNTEDIEGIGREFCRTQEDAVRRIYAETGADIHCCDACPFRDFCSEDRKSLNGFTEWLKQRWD